MHCSFTLYPERRRGRGRWEGWPKHPVLLPDPGRGEVSGAGGLRTMGAAGDELSGSDLGITEEAGDTQRPGAHVPCS